MNEVRAANGMVSSGHPLSAQVGLDVLRKGGNAVDAAVATALAQTVVDPANCGLGAYGGCMMVHEAKADRTVAIDFNGCAPLAAREDMYELEAGGLRSTVLSRDLGVNVKNDEMSRGYRAIAVPGTVAGLGLAHEEFGSMRWEHLVEPAIHLARDGYVVSVSLANSIGGLAHSGRDFPVTVEMFMPEGRPPKPGDRIRLPALAKTLQKIAKGGWQVFYRGEIAQAIAGYIQSNQGILAKEDLESYQAFVCEPYSVAYHGARISTPPLANGGATTLQALNILSGLNPAHWGREAPELIHLFVETFKLTWRDRLEHFGDPKLVAVDVDRLLSSEYAEEKRHRIKTSLAGAPPSSKTGPSTCTTHVCVVDAARNMASLTMTHGMAYGSLVTVPGLGVVMNHGMCRLDPRPGRKNSIAPGKRVLNYMGPILVHRDGKPFLAAGASGGRHIATSVTQLLVSILDFGMSPAEALDVPRCYCDDAEPVLLEHREIRLRRDDQTPFPEERSRSGVKITWRESQKLFQALSLMGHSVEFSGVIGASAHAVLVNPTTGELLSGVDARALGSAVGY